MAWTDDLHQTSAALKSSVTDALTNVPFDSLPQTLAYNANGALNTSTVNWQGHTYVQTLTYNSAGQLTGISNWVQTS